MTPDDQVGALAGIGDVRAADPALADAYAALVAAPRPGPLEPVVQELIGLAAAAACSGIDPVAIRAHAEAALAHGATPDQLREVVQLASIQGIHSMVVGTPLVIEEAKAAGLDVPDPGSPRAKEVEAEFVRRRGYWSPLWDAIASFDPDFLAAYLDYSSIPWEEGTLDPKVRELVYIVLSAVTTHLFPDGMRVHVRNAFDHGATPAELVQVLEIIAAIGIRTARAALPIIDDLGAPS